uniref:Putative capsid n=1 Tax=Caledonia beadlet anemone tombus-like virus 1 TaxID=2021906 RepID=A0A221LFE0_9TOMB|nr:putative capsid [Caledonia beadlet anemone tombus-like virus 1]
MSNRSRNGGRSRIPAPVNGGANRSKRNYTPTVRANGQARTPLLPVGVNNMATMPKASQDYVVRGEEVAAIINVPAGSTPGQIIYNQRITPLTVRRLGILSGAWQRIDWKQASLHLVALNGSLVQSGYTMGWVEDPELSIPVNSSDIIPFLTALRSTTVRQAWVESESGVQVATQDKPEMYTQPGSDVRRYSPGRLVVAVAGDVATAATFQLMLRYNVRLYVPLALTASANPETDGYTAITPTAPNATLSTSSITYPGIGSNVRPDSVVVTTAPIVGIVGATTNPAPPSSWRLFPTGTSLQVGTLAAGSRATFQTGGVNYGFSFIDLVGGQFRAFNPEPPTGTVTSYSVYTYTTS